MPDFHHNLRVYYEDTDEGGVVYHANYLKFAERARAEFLHHHGLSNRDLYRQEGIRMVVKSAVVDYKKPAFLEDDLSVSVKADDISGASMMIHHNITRGQECLVEMTVKIVTINAQGRPVKMPHILRERMERSK